MQIILGLMQIQRNSKHTCFRERPRFIAVCFPFPVRDSTAS